MPKQPSKKEAVDGKAGGVEDTSAIDAGVTAAADDAPADAAEPAAVTETAKMTFSSSAPVALADLNAAAYAAHKQDGELKKRAAAAAQKAIADVLGRAGV